MSLNQCSFIGNLGADPEIRTMQSGDKVANFRIAVTEKWKSREGERRESTEWVTVVAFGGLVNVIEQHLRKGMRVFVQGKWKTRKWQDQSGQDRYSTECTLQGFDSKLQILDGRGEGQRDDGYQSNDGYGGNSGQGRRSDDPYDTDPIPF